MKKFFIFLALIGGGIYLQTLRNKSYDEKAKAEPPAAPHASSPAAAPKPPAAPARPDLRLPYPPTRAQVEAVIPDFAALESRIKSAAANAGLQFKEEDFIAAYGQVWNALLGRGGTPSDRFKWEMGQFDVGGPSRDYDPKIPAEKDAVFQLLQNGQRVYGKQKPATPDGVEECWEQIQVARGTEQTAFSFGTLITTGGYKHKWIKLSWDPNQKAWVRRTLAERQQFVDGYEKKISSELIPAATAKAAEPLDTKSARDALTFVGVFRPAFELRYLPLFAKEFRDIPWGAE